MLLNYYVLFTAGVSLLPAYNQDNGKSTEI